MKIVYNKIFPFGNFKAITLWPFIFAKRPLSRIDINHEEIHGKQQKELLIVGFYVLYILFSIIYGYNKNPFEIEAYANEGHLNYLEYRKKYSWINYFL